MRNGPPTGEPAYGDLAVGETYRSYGRTLTEADLVTFAGLAGLRLPLFLDEDWARAHGPHGGRIAPGFLTASLSAGMIESVLGPDVIAGLALDEFRFQAPVRPGDTLHAEIEILEKRETGTGGRGIVGLAVRLRNQRGETPLSYRSTVMMTIRTDRREAGA